MGQYLTDSSTADGNWVGRKWEAGEQGNNTRTFDGGVPSYIQFPVMYGLGKSGENFALFLDQPYRIKWDFSTFWWRSDMWGDQIRGYLITGPDLPALRRRYLDLVGRPPVPPKKMLGLWVSEFGYNNWQEVDGILNSLRANKFPVDGFVMDLQWYGSGFNDPDNSRMGTLEWSKERFPDPVAKLRELASKGIGLMPIEQSYIAKHLREHADMEKRGFMAKDCPTCGATYLKHNDWWGRGGLIDWTNPLAGQYWHDLKRQPLVNLGIRAHWTDLGEPEIFNPWAWYYGFPESGKQRHADVHNVFALKWLESIADGYRRNRVGDRYYVMTRGGAPGVQRYGAGMWSGDLGGNMGSLRAHLNARMQMSFCGIDYYSSDIGGFYPNAGDNNRDELYTQWFAISSLLDFPVRPHAKNLDKTTPTAPDKVGNLESNRDNLRLRYELAPYYYSLMHLAHLTGDPVLPPLVYHYQWDANVRNIGNEVLIGKDMLMGVVARHGETERNVYLPKGRWVDYHSNVSFTSRGQAWNNVPVYRDGKLKLPLFLRAGAIIPKAYVDQDSYNILGQRADGSRRDDLILRVVPDYTPSSFTVFEDDGITTQYENGKVRTTEVKQVWEEDTVKVTVSPAQGTYANAPTHRNQGLELMLPKRQVKRVSVNDQEISPECQDTRSEPCFKQTKDFILRIKAPNVSVERALIYRVDLQPVVIE